MTSKHPIKQKIHLAVDAVIFTVQDNQLMTLLIQMKKEPFKDQWAFPGGLLGDDELSESAVKRILKSQTGLKNVYLEQLATFDDLKRDPLGRVVSIAYFALVPSENVILETTDKYADVRWWPVKQLPTLAYDHKQISKVAIQRLQSKLEYTNIVWSLLPKTFTLSQLQEIYEIILDREVDKRNFRRKILASKLLRATGRKTAGGAHRPAELYAFKDQLTKIIDLI